MIVWHSNWMKKSKTPDKKKPSHKPKPNRAHRRSKGERGKPHGKVPNQSALRDVSILVISDISEGGELLATPAKWDEGKHPPRIVVTESGRGQALVKGDRILAKMRKISPQLYQALVINILPSEQEKNVLGVFVATVDGGLIEPISRKMKESYIVAREDTLAAQTGELVSGTTLPGMPSMSMSYAKITDRLGRMDSPRAASLIASHMHNLPQNFAPEVLAEANAAEPPVLNAGRTDLRDIPLVTIDGEDARDFDDAVFAERDGQGWHIVVAIADVAYYVKDGSALDASAFERGNSVYFPDRVIPMLPERLSNGLCSLMPNEDRYCLAVHIWIDAQGAMQRYKFVRGLMRSRARLTYEAVEESNKNASSLSADIRILITNLYAAYAALAYERDHRGALDLNLPEYKIKFDDVGNVAAIAAKARLESHRLIEAYMIAANVAAADFLLGKKMPGIYRVHEPPSEDKLEELKTLLKISGYSLHTGSGIKAAHFNRILKEVEGKPEAYLVNISILRSQMQAYYCEENLGHFGLSLQKYGHFTSPIRRYADLVVHRSLASAIDGHSERASKQHIKLAEVALHISDTERKAMMAERDASDRYKVSYMSSRVGQSFSGVIVSLNEYGLFVALNDTGVNGFIPVRNLQGDFFRYDKRHASFTGQRTHESFQIGQPLIIRVQTANATTGSLIFELAKEVTSSERPARPKFDKKRHKRR